MYLARGLRSDFSEKSPGSSGSSFGILREVSWKGSSEELALARSY